MPILLALLLATADAQTDVATIRAKILKGADAAMRGDAAGIMSHYAKDILLSYPGIPDQDYDTLFRGYSEKRPPGFTLKTAPTFDEVLISGDLAVLRLNWTTTIRTTDPAREVTRQARDMQVWRRERDGTWVFVRGLHFRNATPVAISGADALNIIPANAANRDRDVAAIRSAILASQITTSDALRTEPAVVDQPIAPKAIEEILVSGGLGVVRLGDGKQTKELQVWIRSADRWKLARVMRVP
jgi:steroid delta-isomerase